MYCIEGTQGPSRDRDRDRGDLSCWGLDFVGPYARTLFAMSEVPHPHSLAVIDLEAIAAAVNPAAKVTVRPSALPCFEPGRAAEVLLNGQPWGWLGEVAAGVREQLDLRDAVSAVELRVSSLVDVANLIPKHAEVAKFPVSERDLNFVLDEQVPWQELSEVAQSAAGPLLESLSFGGQYRGQQIPPNKKSYVVRLNYRSAERTLTNEEIEAAQQRVIKECTAKLGAALR